MIRTTDVSTSENTVERSTQLIGWDARAQTIRSWTFNADGSFGEAEWHKDTDGWTIVSMQTLADGKHATGTYVLIPQGKDSFSIQLTGHEVDGEPQPTADAVMVVRVPEKSTTEPSQPSSTSTSPAP